MVCAGQRAGREGAGSWQLGVFGWSLLGLLLKSVSSAVIAGNGRWLSKW